MAPPLIMNVLFSRLLDLFSPLLRAFRRFDIAILLSAAALIIFYLWASPIRVHSLTLQDSHFPSKGEFEISRAGNAG